jgi:hypothetical protein
MVEKHPTSHAAQPFWPRWRFQDRPDVVATLFMC